MNLRTFICMIIISTYHIVGQIFFIQENHYFK